MSKYTAGPWVADLDTYPIMVRSGTEKWPLVDELGNKEGEDGVFICNTGDSKENALLIASAPELLEALCEARETLQFASDSPLGPIQDTILMMHRNQTLFDFLDAAIAKARGEQV